MRLVIGASGPDRGPEFRPRERRSGRLAAMVAIARGFRYDASSVQPGEPNMTYDPLSASRLLPHYGFDSPGVIRTCGFVGLALLSVGIITAKAGVIGPAAAALAIVAGLLVIAAGVSLIAYAAAGKYAVRECILALVPWRGDETVLDAGTGRGLLAVGAARLVPSGRVTGIDVWRSTDLIGSGPSYAIRNANVEGVADRVEICDGDIRQTGFADGAFDVVLSLRWLHTLGTARDRAAAATEIARILKPGGRVVVADYVPAGRFAKALADAGLTVERTTACFIAARSPMWITAAAKPR
jgi:ubiquinone/menaquinone biosynthesis C-methylase UbiE